MDPCMSSIAQPLPPPYQDHPGYPNAGYPPPVMYPPSPLLHPYGAQPIPQVQYGHGTHPGQPPVTVQTMVYVTQTPLTKPVPDYMCFSIFTTLCCCPPLGIAALVYSCFTQDAIKSGQQQRAEINSRMARILNNTALCFGLCFIVLSIIIIIIIIVTS